jgi:hypothetical protein
MQGTKARLERQAMSEIPEKITKAELLRHIHSERKQLEELLVRLSPQQMQQLGVVGEQSVKDLLAHMVVWEQRMVAWMEQALHGERPADFPEQFTQELIDRWNAEAYQSSREKTLSQVLAEFRGSYLQALQIIEAASEADLVDADRFAWRRGSPLWRMVAANTWWHYREHREQIEKWLLDDIPAA